MALPRARWSQRQWQRVSQWPLAIAAFAFLIAYALEVLAHLTGTPRRLAEAVINITWAMFVVDYLTNLWLAHHRKKWFLQHLLDLAAVALPFLRPLRLLRLVQLLRVLQRTTGSIVRGRVTLYVLVTTALLVFVSSLAMYDVEHRAKDATIVSYGDALWWSLSTITTVGYGDTYPVTIEGRLIAAAVMIGGIALIGVVTATIASFIIDRVGRRDEAAQSATQQEIRELSAQVRALRDELRSFERKKN
jgi:voltage-gated potassium channel